MLLHLPLDHTRNNRCKADGAVLRFENGVLRGSSEDLVRQWASTCWK